MQRSLQIHNVTETITSVIIPRSKWRNVMGMRSVEKVCVAEKRDARETEESIVDYRQHSCSIHHIASNFSN